MAKRKPILKITKIRITPLFFKVDLCSATSMESSRRDLLNDMSEYRPILKNSQNTYHPRFGFTSKTGKEIPLNRVLFLLCCRFSFFLGWDFLKNAGSYRTTLMKTLNR